MMTAGCWPESGRREQRDAWHEPLGQRKSAARVQHGVLVALLTSRSDSGTSNNRAQHQSALASTNLAGGLGAAGASGPLGVDDYNFGEHRGAYHDSMYGGGGVANSPREN